MSENTDYAELEKKYLDVVAENAAINDRLQKLIQIINNADNSYCMCGDSMKNHAGGGCGSPTGMFDYHYNAWLESERETPATDAAIREIKAQGVDELAEAFKSWADDSNGDYEAERHWAVASKEALSFAASLRGGE